MTEYAYRDSGLSPAYQGQGVRVSWTGNPWSLTGICLLNTLLIIITLGIYWFWARTEYRRHMWRMVRIDDEPLEYTGKGSELLLGTLMVIGFVVVPAIIVMLIAQVALGPQLAPLAVLPLYLAYGFLYFAAIFRAHRYLLTRTRWRGIAFGLEGYSAGYAWTTIWTGILNSLLLGWLTPWRVKKLRAKLTNEMRYGSVPFRFEEDHTSEGLYGPFALFWFGSILFFALFPLALYVVFGAEGLQRLGEMQQANQQPSQEQLLFIAQFYLVILATSLIGAVMLTFFASWYEARKLNLFARALRFKDLQGDLNATGGGIIWLTISNVLIVILSLGILKPIAQARRLKYITERFALNGPIDLSSLVRGEEAKGLQGAGLEAAFAIDVF